MKDDVLPVVMIGAGPSALAAAIYTTREAIDTVLYEKGDRKSTRLNSSHGS